ncbi:hypothetical protein ACJQWK_05538 [Exserohilum turcicum]|uniref:Uncharacterized protein n=1 Tax=Exserohilum turcicum (strain 28A) TaxID=671987 RepID=R0JXQ0_EXST2|nr:uncharacterized protein SETTUDRAFT_157092 [Exserohilum turcica Et28A]EOA82264.1 hypothetical protein SETTUDRAFT_157092 [Exserohilum turcica Et28A]
MSDRDGDSTMHSSPRNGSDDEMFPDEALPNEPVTPHNAHLAGVNDISPPNSQSQTREMLGVNSNGKRPLSGGAMQSSATSTVGASGTHHDAETGYQWSKQEDQPGFEWMNTRAREEENRALDNIVDKGYMIKLRYGDPLDESVAPKTKR